MSSAAFLEQVFDQPWVLLRTYSKSPPEDDFHDRKDTEQLPLLHKDKVPSLYHEPFIITGYRKAGTSVMGSIRYAFILHNDVGNFWTHFLPLLVWLPWLAWLAAYHIDFTDPYYYPTLCFWAGACSYVLFSSMAHLFSNISSTVRSVCFILDYLGIGMYILGGSIETFFHQQPVHSLFYQHQAIVLPALVALAINATLFSGLSRFYWKDYRFVIRAFSFSFPCMTAMVPFVLRFYVCVTTGEECVPETFLLHVIAWFLSLMIAFFFVSKIPERLAPGRFDMFFQSHQLFHSTAALQTFMLMYILPLDAQLRRESLQQVESATPHFYNTFLPLLIAECVGLLVVAVLGVLIVKGVLVSNKVDTKQD